MTARILVVDDIAANLRLLEAKLQAEYYEVMLASSGQEALTIAFTQMPDVILLDVMMPKKDGFEVCREVRKISNVPIIMVTARGEDFERIMGLDIGADDYIIKPFSPGEVMARIRAILRRLEKAPGSELHRQIFAYDNLEIDLDDFQVSVGSEPVSLTKKEIELLWTMATNMNKLFTRENLLNSLWGYDYFGDSRTVDSHIKRLRAKLDAYTHPAWEIKTVWGMGYKFEVHDEV